MSHKDQILDQKDDRPEREGGSARRVAIWSAMIMCGLMIALILLSQPSVSARIQGTAEYVSGRVGAISPGRGNQAVVTPMPSSKLPVRRAGSGE